MGVAHKSLLQAMSGIYLRWMFAGLPSVSVTLLLSQIMELARALPKAECVFSNSLEDIHYSHVYSEVLTHSGVDSD
jgi:hypothetical protein